MKKETSTQQKSSNGIKPIVIKSVCDHEWKRITYGHDKEYFKCKKCGKQDWS